MTMLAARLSASSKLLVVISVLSSIALFYGLSSSGPWSLIVLSVAFGNTKQALWNNTILENTSTAKGINAHQDVLSDPRSDGVEVVSEILDDRISKLDWFDDEAVRDYFQAIGLRNIIVDKVSDDEKERSTPAEVSERALPKLPKLKKKTYYQERKEAGQNLLCYMDNPSAAKQYILSPWMNFASLQQWGWDHDGGVSNYNHVKPGVSHALDKFHEVDCVLC